MTHTPTLWTMVPAKPSKPVTVMKHDDGALSLILPDRSTITIRDDGTLTVSERLVGAFEKCGLRVDDRAVAATA